MKQQFAQYPRSYVSVRDANRRKTLADAFPSVCGRSLTSTRPISLLTCKRFLKNLLHNSRYSPHNCKDVIANGEPLNQYSASGMKVAAISKDFHKSHSFLSRCGYTSPFSAWFKNAVNFYKSNYMSNPFTVINNCA